MGNKSIFQLIPDIYESLKTRGGFTNELTAALSVDLSKRLQLQFGGVGVEQLPGEVSTLGGEALSPTRNTLRLSQMGPRCPKALWNSVHHPELAEALPPWAEIKYAFGHVIEALAIALAKAAGHQVEGEQDAVYVDGIAGHRDCVIDGCIVDVKSSSSRGFGKFKDGTLRENDSFGYLDQLDGYVVGSLDDPLVKVKDKGYILAIDKQLGHMVLYEHIIRPERIRDRIAASKQTIARAEAPACTCGTEPDGVSGNIKLDLRASYNLYKHSCFPNLRTFLYVGGPRYLVKVVRTPDVTEVDKNGKIIYN